MFTGRDLQIGGSGGGDANELSQLTNNEAILLTLGTGSNWVDLWVSSLASGGTNNAEQGKLYWGDDIATLFAGTADSFSFKYGDFGGLVYGNLTSISGFSAAFDFTARNVLFVPGGAGGDNNDYLVWGVDTRQTGNDPVVPEPASSALLATGLVALVARRWWHKKA